MATAFVILVIGCNDNEDTIGGLTINFAHHWDGENITSEDFNEFKYSNANGEILSISKLKYLVSNISLHQSNGNMIEIKDYFLVDVTSSNLSTSQFVIPAGIYSGVSFTFGFNEIKNIDGAYSDLNATSWNWPEILGGGYHFMQFEGKYESGGNENPFAYHMGTAKTDSGEYEVNHFEVFLSLNEFTVSNDTTLKIAMNVSEWFKNPIIWDLNSYDTNLMPNYEAQKLMNQNGRSVFSYRN